MSSVAEDPAPHDVSDTLTTVKNYFADRAGMAPVNQILTIVTNAYLEDLDLEDPPHPIILEQQLLGLVNATIDSENQKAARSNMKTPGRRTLDAGQVARVLLRLHHIKRIAPSAKDTDREYDLLAMYQTTGPEAGTYTASEDEIRKVARRYNWALSLNDFREVLAVLRENSERVHTNKHRDLIAVENGVFHYGSTPIEVTIAGRQFRFEPKSLHPFDPALVFLTKCHVAYVPEAVNPVITNPDGTTWDIVSWIEELSDDESMAELIWEVIGAIIRPHVRWNKTAWFYSEQGNNGKGTLCALMRNLVGPGAHTALPLSDFGKDFALEPLVRASAIITDENDVGTFIDQAANLKAIVTGDVIPINRKHRMPVALQFEGFMVQCLNEFPRMKDKSESNYRRQLFVPFKKWFGGGAERRYIKDDYLQRSDVLEYALWHVLHRAGTSEHKGQTTDAPGSYYTLSEPPATCEVLEEYKEANDPVRAFWTEFRDRFQWDLLPFTFLYDLYKSWFHQVSPSGSPVSRQQFAVDLVAIVAVDTLWHCQDKSTKHRPGQMMSLPEHLIVEFDLKAWKAPACSSSDPDKISRPLLKPNYRGILRRPPQQAGRDQAA